jgi:hypothetical protein
MPPDIQQKVKEEVMKLSHIRTVDDSDWISKKVPVAKKDDA